MGYTQDSSFYVELGPHFEWELWTPSLKWVDPMLPFDWKMNFLIGTSILCTLTPSPVLGFWNKIQDLEFVCCLLSNWSHKIIHKYSIHDFIIFLILNDFPWKKEKVMISFYLFLLLTNILIWIPTKPNYQGWLEE